jgi:hypothetical protein
VKKEMTMKTILKLLALGTVFLAACGDNKEVPDAGHKDAAADANCSNCPAAPALGTQIDRMGRPAINTALNHGFDANMTTAQAAKTAYNIDGNSAGWQAAYVPAFMQSLAIVDAIDMGFCGNSRCEVLENQLPYDASTNPGGCPADCTAAGTIDNPCGNQPAYKAPADPTMSYLRLAGLLANDEIYVDTNSIKKGVCGVYLAIEFAAAIQGAPGTNETCGGRTLEYDVIDSSLSVLSAGVAGLTPTFQPKIGDDVPKHTDYLTDFPYLGVPHVTP